MAAMQGSLAMFDQVQMSCPMAADKVASSDHYAKGLPSINRPHRRNRSKAVVVASSSQNNLPRGQSVKAAAAVTASPDISTSVNTSRESLEKEATAPSWAEINDEISIGPCPRSPRDLEILVQNTGSNAFLFLETNDGCRKLGLDWEKFREKASQQGVVAVRIAMRDDDQQDQAASLPEAVRAVAALAALGYKTHISCASGIQRSPLVALGYLTFVKSMEFTQAVQLISSHNPAAQPSFDAWEEAKTKITAGDMKRVAQLAQDVSHKRLQSKRAGTPADDWLVAQRLLVAEAFERGISTDVTLSDAIAKAATIRATKTVLEELTSTKAEAEKAKQTALTSEERLEFFSRQIEALKEKEEVATKTAEGAVKDSEVLKSEVETLKVKEKEALQGAQEARRQVAMLTAKVAELEAKEASLKTAATEATEQAKELQLLLKNAAEREGAAKKEIINANARLYTLSAKYATLEASLSDARKSKELANERVSHVLTQIDALSTDVTDSEELSVRVAELAKKEAAAKAALASAQERLDFYGRQMQSLKAKEEVAKQSILAANAKAEALAGKVQELTNREAAARQAAEAAHVEVTSLKSRLTETEKQLAEARKEAAPYKAAFDAKVKAAIQERAGEAMHNLEKELFLSNKREAQARGSAVAANDKVEFFYRHMELLKQREEKAKQANEQRISAFTQQAADLRAKLAAAETLAKENNMKIEAMSQQVAELTKRDQAATEAAKVAGERIDFFHRHVDLLRTKEAAARQAADMAMQKVKLLQSKVENLERREALAIAQCESMKEKMATLVQINSELGFELAETKEREDKLAEALEEGTGMLQVALEADETITQLRQEAERAAQDLLESRMRADKMAQELERELSAAGKRPGTPPPSSKGDRSPPPGGEKEQQLQTQMAAMQHTITATGGGSAVAAIAVDHHDGKLDMFRNLVLGALGVAAVPFTLMSSLTGNSPNSNLMASFVHTESRTADQLLAEPVVQPASAGDFCQQVGSGSRSVRVDRFCSTVDPGLME